LCPRTDGLLKPIKTDKDKFGETKYCHVRCAIYIPDLWFLNTSIMEPVMVS
jgi:hypothetical protein